MAKNVQTESIALQALAVLLADPSPRVLLGSTSSPGVFLGAAAANKAAGQHCLDKGWLEPTGEFAGKGKARKELYRLTAAGLQAVLARGDPAALLQALGDRLERMRQESAALPEKFAEMSNHVVTLQRTIQQTANDLRVAIGHAAERAKPPDLEELRRLLGQPVAKQAAAAEWIEEVVRLAAEQKKRHLFQLLTLPQIYEQLRARYPDLTLGQYHDGLRRLQEQGRIRLRPFTQALPTLDDPRNALYLDREVKYYVELA